MFTSPTGTCFNTHPDTAQPKGTRAFVHGRSALQSSEGHTQAPSGLAGAWPPVPSERPLAPLRRRAPVPAEGMSRSFKTKGPFFPQTGRNRGEGREKASLGRRGEAGWPWHTGGPLWPSLPASAPHKERGRGPSCGNGAASQPRGCALALERTSGRGQRIAPAPGCPAASSRHPQARCRSSLAAG